MVKQCGGTVEQCWWNSGTVLVEQWKRDGGTVRWNSVGGGAWWNSGTVLEEQWNSVGGTVWWYSGTLLIKRGSGTVKSDGGTVAQC